MADPFADGTFCPSVPASYDAEWRMQVAQFGDGYAQRQLDGINPLNRSWDLEFNTRLRNEIAQMEIYLRAMGASAFPFVDPATGLPWMVFCDGWSVEWDMVRFLSNGTREVYGSLSTTFREANGFGVPVLGVG